MDLSNAKNLVQQLGLKPCPLCGNHIYIDSITMDRDNISELQLHCGRCNTEYRLNTPIITALNEKFALADVIDIWNERKDEENG